jgi:phenylacetic acid degradation operon negative regulatory protein
VTAVNILTTIGSPGQLAVYADGVKPEDDSALTYSTRPQSLMLSFLGIYLAGRDIAVSSGSVIELFGRVGVTEEAVRSTVSRMVKRGMLTRHKDGRRVYLGLTAHATAVLRDGAERIWRTGVVDRDWDGSWTLVGFSMPDSRRNERHDLRSRLVWAGFGLLQNGLWIAAGTRDAAGIAAELGLTGDVTVFTARPASPTESVDLVRKAFDTEAIAARYNEFLGRWAVGSPLTELPDDFARQLILHTDWLQLVRQDPHLPAALLAPDWPAIRAEELFRRLAAQYGRTAPKLAAEVMEELAV